MTWYGSSPGDRLLVMAAPDKHVHYLGGSRNGWLTIFLRILLVGCVVGVVFCAIHFIPMMAMMEDETKAAAAFSVEDLLSVSNVLTKFSASLYQVVAESVGEGKNMFVSPFSIATVLAMAHPGMLGNTAKQVKSALHIDEVGEEKFNAVIGHLLHSIKGNENYTLETVNQIFVANNYHVLPEFQSTLKHYFHADARSVDFHTDVTRVRINEYVEEFTRHKIKDLLKPGSLTSLTKLVLLNALYFKGNWNHKFKVEDTVKQPFYLGSMDNEVEVDMMHMEAKMNNGDLLDLDARVLELPYTGGELSMFIILPNKVDGLPQLEKKLFSSNLLERLGWGVSKTKIHVAIPKFKVESDLNLNEQLKQLGMTDMFDDCKADLSAISGKKDLVVSDVVHKTYVQVNEEGSEAAAATAMVIVNRMMIIEPPPPPPFIADRPFMFAIRDNIRHVTLFTGRLFTPN